MGEDGFDSPSYIPTTNIYLGGAGEAKDYALLKHLGITHVLNTAIQLPNFLEDHFIYYNVAIEDSEKVSIYKHLQGAAIFLEHVHAVGGRVCSLDEPKLLSALTCPFSPTCLARWVRYWCTALQEYAAQQAVL